MPAARLLRAPRLGVPDLAQIPGGYLGAGLPKVLRTVVSRRYEGTHRDARVKSGSPAIRRPAGPGPPPQRRSPAQARLASALLGVLRAASRAAL